MGQLLRFYAKAGDWPEHNDQGRASDRQFTHTVVSRRMKPPAALAVMINRVAVTIMIREINMTQETHNPELVAEGFSKTELNLTMNFLDQIPFNKLLGLKPRLLSDNRCEFTMSMRDDLVGNWLQGILHGGAISTALDVTGGAMALIAAWQRMHKKDVPKEERPKQLSKLGTIDMRVDFLHPGKGKEFVASASLLRIGNKVAVTRMEFHNEEGTLIAVGTGTYLCG